MITSRAFFQDLSHMSFGALAEWLTDMLRSAYPYNEISADTVETLYDDFLELIHMTGREAQKYPTDEKDVLLKNADAFQNGEFKRKYRKVVVAVHNPKPSYWVETDKAAPVNISSTMYRALSPTSESAAQKANAAISKKWKDAIDKYIETLGEVLEDDETYRINLRDFIMDKNVLQSGYLYHMTSNKITLDPNKDLDAIVKDMAQYKVVDLKKLRTLRKKDEARNRGFTNEAPWDDERGGLKEMSEYGISRTVFSRYVRGIEVKKPFLINLAFFLGIDIMLAERLLDLEGFSIRKSVKPADRLYKNCFTLGFPKEFANVLLVRKGLIKETKGNA